MERAMSRAIEPISPAIKNLLGETSVLDAMSDAISIQDINLRIIYQNPAHKQLAGDHAGEFCYAAYQNKDETCEGCHLIRSYTDGLSYTRETTKLTDKGLRYVEISSSPLRDADGQIVGGIESIRDITERRELEEKSRLQQAALEACNDGIAIYHDTGNYFSYVNQALVKLFGYDSTGELLNKSWQILYSPEESARLEHDARILVDRKGKWRGEAVGKRKDGSTFPLEISASRINDHNTVVIYADISERRQQLEELNYANECLSQTLNGSQHVLYRLNVTKGCYDYLSPFFEHITGHRVAEFKEKSLAQVGAYFHPDDRSRVFAAIEEASSRRTGSSFNLDLDYRFKKANGGYCWLHDSTTACFDESGNLEFFFGSAIDITQRKEAEELLAKNEERLQAIFDTMQAGIILVNPYGVVTFANQRMADMFACTLDELIGSSYPEHVHPDQRDLGDERMRALIAGEIDHVYSERHYSCKDGRDFWGHLSGRRLEDVDGNLLLLVGVIADISELKQIQSALQLSETRYRRFPSKTSDFLTICQRRESEPFRAVWLGGSMEAITGFSKEQILEWGCWLTIVHPDDVQRVSRQLHEQKPGNVSIDDFRIIRKDGEIRWIHEIARCEEGSAPGEIVRYGSAQDVTKRKEVEAEIHDLNEHLEQLVVERTIALERSNEELATFCYAVSHELRAPIARLQGFSGLLGEACRDSAEASFMASRIADASRLLQSVVDAILQLSRLSNVELSMQRIDLSELVTGKLKQHCAESPERAIAFDVMPGVMVVADPKMMDVCLTNLIGNAFKYTGKAAETRIEFGMVNEGGDEVYFVRDNGAGFDMAYSDKLFTPFQRLHMQDEFPGIGIGLATVKKVIELHGGDIWAKSSVGQGATFYFTLRGKQ
ncbi:MAG: PAS domain S-box protein [Geobacter sp.]|nr:PAS domain S-box protein [Geobacter sp.]